MLQRATKNQVCVALGKGNVQLKNRFLKPNWSLSLSCNSLPNANAIVMIITNLKLSCAFCTLTLLNAKVKKVKTFKQTFILIS